MHSLRAGGHFGRYQIQDLIGEGAMGTVYRALDTEAGREVALKIPKAASSQERSQREGIATARLRHPGIVTIFDSGEIAGVHYLAYELIPGARELGDASPELTLRQRVAYLRDAAVALGHAHAHGVVHRDVKPGNLLLGEERLRVADFGLARVADAASLTKTGTAVGTPFTMSPEAILGKKERVGPASDVWSLGVTLYWLLVGQYPFGGDTLTELARSIVSVEPERLTDLDPTIDPALEAIVRRSLEKSPEDRYRDGSELGVALGDYLAGIPRGARKPRSGLVVSVAVAGVFLCLVLLAFGVGRDRAASSDESLDDEGSALRIPLPLARALKTAEDPRFRDTPNTIEVALSNPAFAEPLSDEVRARIHLVGVRLLEEARDETRPQGFAAYIRVATRVRKLSRATLPLQVEIDGFLGRLDPDQYAESGWVSLLRTLKANDLRPSQRAAARFLETLSPGRRGFARTLLAMLALGAPASEMAFEVVGGLPTENEDAGPLSRYLYLRQMIAYHPLKDSGPRAQARQRLGRLLIQNPDAFDPRTLLQGLSSVNCPREQIGARISLVQGALDRAPDSFHGWLYLIGLHLSQAEIFADEGKSAQAIAAIEAAAEVLALGRRVFPEAQEAGRNPPDLRESVRPRTLQAGGPSAIERMIRRGFLRVEIELAICQGRPEPASASALPREALFKARESGARRLRRLRAALGPR